MKLLLLSIVIFAAQFAFADDPACTEASREQWIKTDEMKSKAQSEGYKIKKFMTLEKCYEIQGEKDGKKVDDLFNPVDGTFVKSVLNKKK